jgi:hypothetical protein
VTPPAAAPAAGAPFAVFPDAESFNERMARHHKAELKKLGIEDPAALKTTLEEAKRVAAENEKKRQEEMSELEREKEARTKAESELVALRTAKEKSEREAAWLRVFSAEGVKNLDYANFAVEQAIRTAGEGVTVDPAAVIRKLKETPAGMAALGLETAATPATTTSGGDGANPPKPPGTADDPNAKKVSDMTPEQFRQHREKLTGYAG